MSPSMELTVREYAELTRTTRQAVLARIARGTLEARRQEHSGIWLIPVYEDRLTGKE